MKVLGGLLPIAWLLAFLSPLSGMACAAVFYGRYCRKKPNAERRLTGVVYVLVLVVCAVVAYPLGVGLGIHWACPSAGNLCGLAGFFVVGPVASTLAILIAGWLLTATS
jgi:hypothetical protein